MYLFKQHQLELLNTLSRDFATNEYRLLIIDSIMNCFRVDFCGRGELADRQQKLNQFLSKLAHMAEGLSARPPFPSLLLIITNKNNRVQRLRSHGTNATTHRSAKQLLLI